MASHFNAAESILGLARSHPRFNAKPALIQGDRIVTYAELSADVDHASNLLTSLGLRRGDRVGLLMNDSPLAGAAFLGAVAAGIVPMPLNTRLAPEDYAFIAADSQAKLFIVEPEYRPNIANLPASLSILAARGNDDSFEARLVGAGKGRMAAPTDANEPAFLLYSSGTTGRPKGILLSHHTCAGSGKLLREAMRADESTVVLTTSKMFFAYGLENGLLAPLRFGATSIQFSEWAEPETVVSQVARHGATCVLTVPTFYRRMLCLGAERLAPMRRVHFFYTGGERLPESLANEWQAAVGKPLHVGYGLSETHCNVTANFPDRNRGAASIGEPLADVQCRILDLQGNEVARGEPGILWIKHPTIAIGYTDPAATARAFRDGWFCTNDLCTMDDAGFIYHHGRGDELLKIAGQWVKPSEVEDTALADARVREAACVVVRNAEGFDRLALFIVPATPGEGAAAAEVRCEAALPRYSRPTWIREVDELPKNATGKVQRFRLREALLRELGHHDALPRA